MEKEIIDLEIYAKDGKTPPAGKRYQFRVDNAKHSTEKESLKGKEVLELAGKLPIEKFQLNQRIKGGMVKRIGLNEVVSLLTPGLERFMTVPLDQTEG